MGYSVFPAPSGGLTVSDLITEPTLTLLGSSTNTAAATTRTISSISTAYKKLYIYINGLVDCNNYANVGVRFNSDAANRYTYLGFQFKQTTTGQTRIVQDSADYDYMNLTYESGMYSTGKYYGVMEIEDYASTTSSRKIGRFKGTHTGGENTPYYEQADFIYHQSSASAITSIDVFVNAGTAALVNSTSGGIFVFGAK